MPTKDTLDFSEVPDGIRPSFETLRNDLIGIRFRWAAWKRLFQSSQEARDLLVWGAPSFFEYVYRVFLSDVCLGICRLLDAPGEGERSNLVLSRLVSLVREAGHPELAEDMRMRIADARRKAERLFVWRNKYHAHRDLQHAFDESLATSAALVFAEIDAVLEVIGSALNLVESKFTEGTTFFGDPIDPGPDQVIGKLRDAKRWRDLPPEIRFGRRAEA